MNEVLQRASVRLLLALGGLLVGWLVVLVVLNAFIIGGLLMMFPANENGWSPPTVIVGLLSVAGSVALFILGIAGAGEAWEREK